MYSIETDAGTKLVGKLDIANDRVRGPSGSYSIMSIHSVWSKIFVVKAEKNLISFPGFVEVKTNAGYIPANKLIPGLELSQYGVDQRILQTSDPHPKLRVKKVSVPGSYYISGVEVRNT